MGQLLDARPGGGRGRGGGPAGVLAGDGEPGQVSRSARRRYPELPADRARRPEGQLTMAWQRRPALAVRADPDFVLSPLAAKGASVTPHPADEVLSLDHGGARPLRN